MLARLRTSFLTGIVVIAPVALTLWLIWSVIGWFDGFVLPFVRVKASVVLAMTQSGI